MSADRTRCELIVALDTPSLAEAEAMVDALRPEVTWFKVGLELFSAAGPAAVAMVRAKGGRVFADLKLHDIPNTVTGAAASLARAGADMLNVHAGGGRAMMAAAAESVAAASAAGERPLVLAVTVLTSLDRAAWADTYGQDVDPLAQVVRLASLARDAGLDGVVCSIREAAAVRAACGPAFAIVTPGVRPAGAAANDQARTATTADAVRAGSTHIVVGRPITRAGDPRQAALDILKEIEEAGQ
ncbi:MAG: orotidine-5'-phosphate decarboxylase [Chloroflexota bacterium]